VEQDKLHFKMPSKTKIYLINQTEFESVSPQEIETMTQAILQKSERAKELKSQLQNLKSKSSEITAMADLINQQTFLQSRLSELLNKVNEATGGVGAPSIQVEEKKEKVKKLAKEWRIRKRKGSEMLETIFEAYPKPPKVFIEENDIQYDTEPIPII
jgi:DNA repair exonuclease SbcCD ATPase subunit